jgi:hypothetical protein
MKKSGNAVLGIIVGTIALVALFYLSVLVTAWF